MLLLDYLRIYVVKIYHFSTKNVNKVGYKRIDKNSLLLLPYTDISFISHIRKREPSK